MASPEYTRSFLSGQLLVGVKRFDPHNIRFIKMPLNPLQKNDVKPVGRYLSEEPSTYIR